MKTKILIAGIGGVGGYFGGLLAKHFEDSEKVEVSFYARGSHLAAIQKNGLKIIKGDVEFIARPSLAFENPDEMDIADFIIVATKSYDLEEVIQQLHPCIDNDTIILPLLNGVDSRERIKNILPDNMVLDGCAYLVSRLKEDGVVVNSGNIQKLYFGLDNFTNERLVLLEGLFKEAGIEAYLSTNISTVIWEKYIFISSTATATSYFDTGFGEVVADQDKLRLVNALIEEVKLVAEAKGVKLPEDITEKTLTLLKSIPSGATSSMHSDFKSKKPKKELQSLTGFVLSEGRKYNIETPTYVTAFEELKVKV